MSDTAIQHEVRVTTQLHVKDDAKRCSMTTTIPHTDIDIMCVSIWWVE